MQKRIVFMHRHGEFVIQSPSHEQVDYFQVLFDAGGGSSNWIEDLAKLRCIVYLLEVPEIGCMKIGLSDDPKRRMLALQTAMPFEVRWIGGIACETTADAKRIEGELHSKFSATRLRGEWFRASERIYDEFRRNGCVVSEQSAAELDAEDEAAERKRRRKTRAVK